MDRVRYFFTFDKRFQSERDWLNWLVWGIAIVWCCFQLWTARMPLAGFYQRSVHFLFVFILIFLTTDLKKKGLEDRLRWDGIIFALLTIICITYAYATWSTKAFTRGTAISLDEMLLGWIFVFLTLEVCRRAVGWSLPIICVVLIIYGRFGESLPGSLAHRDYSFERMIMCFYISMDGIMGYLAHVSTTFIFVFVTFGSFLRISGGGDFFIKLAYALFGHVRGGPAKVAVVASTLFGMVSGSAMANVAGTGQFTIPLMKKYGYPSHFAGGVEATSSAGGAIMPPIMGGAAFIIIEVLGISYIAIMKAVVLIAFLYYLSIFTMIDIEAQKLGLKGIPREELPSILKTLKKGWFFLIPPIILLYLLAIVRYSPTLSGLYATLSIIVFSWFGKNNRMGPRRILMGMEDACYTFRPIGAVLACAGIIVAVVNITGLGLMLGTLLLKLSHGILPLLLFLTMVTSIILGMGVPNTASYIVLSILVAPALIKMGILPLAAHLYIFYFATFAGITPPLAPDAFVAAGIAKAPAMKTAISACRIGLIGLILPYMMIYNQAFLLIGDLSDILLCAITAAIGIFSLGSAIVGYLYRPLKPFYRFCLLISALVMIIPNITTDLIGFGLLLVIVWRQNPKFYIDVTKKYFFSSIFRLRRFW